MFSFRIRRVLLLAVLFIATDGLGFGINTEALSFNSPIGSIPVVHLFTMMVVILSLAGPKRNWRSPNHLKLPIILLFSLFFIAALKTIIEFVFFSSVSLNDIMYNILKMHIYLFFFPLIFFIRNEDELIRFLKGVMLIGVMAAFVIYYQFIFGVSFYGSEIKTSMAVTRLYRIMFPGSPLVSATYFTLLSVLLLDAARKRRIVIMSLVILLAVASILNMHRNMFVVTCLVTLGLVFIIRGNRLKSVLKLGILLLGVLIIFPNVLSVVGLEKTYFAHNLSYTLYELETGIGSIWWRLDLLNNVINDVVANYPFLGKGFNFSSEGFDYLNYVFTRTTTHPTNDNSIVNIILVFGFVGLTVFLFVFYRVFRTCIILLKMYKKEKRERLLKAVLYGCLATNAMIVMKLFVSDHIMGNPATVIMILSWAILYLLYEFNQRRKLSL